MPYERQPTTLGQHLKKRRLELALRQRDIQERFNLDKETYATWEKDRRYPAMKHWPDIIKFLGYDPSSEPQTIGERLVTYRRRHGLTREELAHQLGADEATVWRWEVGERKPNHEEHIKALKRLGVELAPHCHSPAEPDPRSHKFFQNGRNCE